MKKKNHQIGLGHHRTRPNYSDVENVDLPRYVIPYFFVGSWSFGTYRYGRELYVPIVEVRVQAGNRRACLKFFPKRYYNDGSDYDSHGQETKPHESTKQHTDSKFRGKKTSFIRRVYIIMDQ